MADTLCVRVLTAPPPSTPPPPNSRAHAQRGTQRYKLQESDLLKVPIALRPLDALHALSPYALSPSRPVALRTPYAMSGPDSLRPRSTNPTLVRQAGRGSALEGGRKGWVPSTAKGRK
eukprot:3891520-Rhodomonas_salina.1